MLDKVSKGRHPSGESHYATKLSDSQILGIRKLASDNIISADIARMYDITPNYVSQIINNTRRILKEV
jgi:plasmid maintenance system antidote protein VapI